MKEDIIVEVPIPPLQSEAIQETDSEIEPFHQVQRQFFHLFNLFQVFPHIVTQHSTFTSLIIYILQYSVIRLVEEFFLHL